MPKKLNIPPAPDAQRQARARAKPQKIPTPTIEQRRANIKKRVGGLPGFAGDRKRGA